MSLHAFLWQPDSPLGGGSGSLADCTVAIKDNICHQGWPTTAGSRLLENFVPPYSSTVTQRLLDAGAALVGKTNMDEFGMGSSTENSAFGVTRNPWDAERVPGGSSGGSAAAVAAGLCDMALGSDTGGSIRQPAALCGITGLKPTYGRVSRYGLIAYASSLDQIGPMAYGARDCARLLNVIAGPDPLDATCSEQAAPDFLAQAEALPTRLRVGVDEALLQGLRPDMRANFDAALQVYRQLGAEIVPVSLSLMSSALPAYYVIATAEASSNLARYDGVRYGRRVEGSDIARMMTGTRTQGFGAEVKRRIMLGTYVLSAGYADAYYHQAQKVRTLLRRDVEAALKQADVLALPVTPTPAFRLGEKTSDPMSMYLSDIYTIHANLTGLPALSHPSGFVEDLPVGFQLLGPAWGEGLLLGLAMKYQSVTDHHFRRPVQPASASGRS